MNFVDACLKHFDCNPETGDCWRLSEPGIFLNTVYSDGYHEVSLRKVESPDFNTYRLKTHRIVYALCKKEEPDSINHLNGLKTDNRICNLESGSCRNNNQQRESHRKGALFGASFKKELNKWRSQIKYNSHSLHLGLFNSEQEAHNRYLEFFNSLTKTEDKLDYSSICEIIIDAKNSRDKYNKALSNLISNRAEQSNREEAMRIRNEQIRSLYDSGVSRKDLSEQFSMSQNQVYKIVNQRQGIS